MTEFQKQVYKVVWKIPQGQTLSYKEVAQKAGRLKSYRAVGNIMHNHNIKGLPCHRVIRSDGSIGGFGRGPKEKQKLLKKERAI